MVVATDSIDRNRGEGVVAEYRERPGLPLTIEQAQRLRGRDATSYGRSRLVRQPE